MKITVGNVGDFIDEVNRSPAVYQNAVRMLTDFTPLQAEAISHGVKVCLTALIVEDEGSEYLLEYVENCGVDHPEAGLDGTGRSMAIRGLLDDTLRSEIAVRPGRLEA